jgi:hypothetical protein
MDEEVKAQIKRAIFWLQDSPYVPPKAVQREPDDEPTDEDIINEIAQDHD